MNSFAVYTVNAESKLQVCSVQCEYIIHVLQVDLSRIKFRDDKARQKMILLAGRRYDASSNMLTLVGDRCPTRKQNKDHLIYLIKVLYLESHVS